MSKETFLTSESPIQIYNIRSRGKLTFVLKFFALLVVFDEQTKLANRRVTVIKKLYSLF